MQGTQTNWVPIKLVPFSPARTALVIVYKMFSFTNSSLNMNKWELSRALWSCGITKLSLRYVLKHLNWLPVNPHISYTNFVWWCRTVGYCIAGCWLSKATWSVVRCNTFLFVTPSQNELSVEGIYYRWWAAFSPLKLWVTTQIWPLNSS